MSNSKTYIFEYKKVIDQINLKVENFSYTIDGCFFIPPKYDYYDKIIISHKSLYKKIIVNQKNKKRILFEPFSTLKVIQQYILHEILYKNSLIYNLDECVTGFVPNITIIDNARPHLNKKVLIKMDIKNFFPSITRKRVYDIFRKQNKFPYEYSYLLSKLVTFEDKLPQGSPTSPFLANICAKGIDAKVNTLIKKIMKTKNIKINYTRYADDLTISLDSKMNYDYIISAIINIIESEGFTPNYKKIKVIKNSQCQLVTGIVVNSDKPKIQKKELNKVKFILHIWEKYSLSEAVKLWNKHKLGKVFLNSENAEEQLIDIIQGKISFYVKVNKNQSAFLLDKYKELNKKQYEINFLNN